MALFRRELVEKSRPPVQFCDLCISEAAVAWQSCVTPPFRNNPISCLPFVGYIDDTVVSSVTCPKINAIYAKYR